MDRLNKTELVIPDRVESKAGGRPLNHLIVQKHVTARKQAKARLRESEARYRTLVENIHLGIGLIDRQYRILASNNVLARMVGGSVEENVGQECFRVHEKREAVCPHCPGARAMETGEPAEAETQAVRNDGSRYDVSVRAYPVYDSNGTPNGFIEVVEDITERKRADEAVRQSEEKYKRLAEACADGVVMADLSGQILFASRQMCELFGVAGSDELIGRSISELVVESDRRRLAANLANLLEVGLRRNTEYTAIRRDGTTLPVESSTSVMRDAHGRAKAVTGTIRDITGRKQVERELAEGKKAAEAANRAKSEFLANMSHEIRTPMTAILGFTDVLLEDLTKEGDIECAKIVKRNGEHLLQIINNILDLSRIEAGKTEIERRACSPRHLAAEVVSMMKVRADTRRLELTLDIGQDVPDSIQTDPVRLRQILLNLVENAIKFTHLGSVNVVVRCDAPTGEQDRLRFDVTDTGIGISQEVLPALFQPFSQADASNSRRFGGSGLGLAISKRLAEMLGGDISVTSDLGKGSTFSVFIATGLPERATVTPTSPEPTDAPPTPSGQPQCEGRVLLAEDAPDNQRLISLLLRKAGFEFTLAENGQRALDLALAATEAERPFDAILMDIQMPVMDGYEATRRLRDAGYRKPIIALTANAMTEDRQRCLDAGCDDYLSKPVKKQDLLRLLNAWVAENRTPATALPPVN